MLSVKEYNIYLPPGRCCCCCYLRCSNDSDLLYPLLDLGDEAMSSVSLVHKMDSPKDSSRFTKVGQRQFLISHASVQIIDSLCSICSVGVSTSKLVLS